MKYRVLQLTEFPAGSVFRLLTSDQVRRRLHALRKIDEEHHETTRMVQFKRGELIEFSGDIPKAWLGVRLEAIGQTALETAPAPSIPVQTTLHAKRK